MVGLSVIYRYSLASCRVYAMIAMATAPAGEILSFTLIFRQKSSGAWQTLKHDAVLIEAMESRSLR